MSISKTTRIASLIALALALIPASLTPAGQIEVNGLCASNDCVEETGSVCVKSTGPVEDYHPIIG